MSNNLDLNGLDEDNLLLVEAALKTLKRAFYQQGYRDALRSAAMHLASQPSNNRTTKES